MNLELEKNAIIEILKAFKKTEDFFTKDMYKKKLVPHQKQIDLRISNKN
ncbi:ErpA protein (erpA) (plasmid) [Borrelia coriaceae ATCC 43381]|uniref:ErpA protein (ErpA) n=1 Tax=Borrelia coriaceae ATCC 43381 TaxID=1408429 RepID=W5SY67_9SPIR|nr:ErpA protein (erpA) [Borrelia coriaceae ATCC 43381]